MDTEGVIKIVRINGMSILSGLNLEKMAGFFPQGQSKLSIVIMRGLY